MWMNPSHSQNKKISGRIKGSKNPKSPNEAEENMSVLMMCQFSMSEWLKALCGILSFYVEMGYLEAAGWLGWLSI